MMNRSLLSVCSLLILGLAACDRPPPQVVAERAAEVAPHTTDDFLGSKRVLLVTGATGTQGGAVARELLDRGHIVHGLTRDPESEEARALAALGAKMVKGDFDDPASLAAAVEGVDGVFGVTLFWPQGYEYEVEQGKRLIDAAVKAGVGRFVLTSVAGADDDTGISHFESKWEVEQYLHGTDLDWTILRPVEFMDNWSWSIESLRQGRYVDPRDTQSSHQWIAARDIGFFAAEAFDNPDQWIGVTKEIAGDVLTLAELIDTLSEAFGREFEHVQISWEVYKARAGEEITTMVRWFEEQGYDVDVEALREQYPGLQTAAEFLADLAVTAPR